MIPQLLAGSPDSGADIDSRTESDPPTDPRPEPPHDPPPDPPSPDADTDPGCTPLTELGTCNVVNGCGCTPGFTCKLVVDARTCTLLENCIPDTGSMPPEAPCTGPGQCAAGSVCRSTWAYPPFRCYQLCSSDEDCTVPGRSCSRLALYPSPECETTFEAPLMVCDTACEPDAGCNLFAMDDEPTSCLDGYHCVFDLPPPLGCDISLCYPSGTQSEGEECYTNGLDCSKGTVCLSTDGVDYHCFTYCDESHPCETGDCMSIDSESRPDLGVCQST